jgi:predicted transposase/invertase (TIGR01784 family)
MLCNKFEKWLHILKFGDYYRTEADLPGGLRKETGIIEVIQKMSIANTDEQMRYELLARDMFLSDLATDLDAAENKGRQQGRQEGRQEGKIEIALKMIAKGRSFEEISDITELSTDQVKKLAENNKVSEPATKYKAKRKTTKPRKK